MQAHTQTERVGRELALHLLYVLRDTTVIQTESVDLSKISATATSMELFRKSDKQYN